MTSQQGLSLIEVLIALIVVTVGLIGILNLHTLARRASIESFQQTQAVYLAHDMLNRIRLNSRYASAYTGNYDSKVSSSAKICDSKSNASACNAVEMLAWDKFQWQQLLIGVSEQKGEVNLGGLNQPVACIYAATDMITIVIAWRGSTPLSKENIAVDPSYVTACGSQNELRRRYVLTSMV